MILNVPNDRVVELVKYIDLNEIPYVVDLKRVEGRIILNIDNAYITTWHRDMIRCLIYGG